MDTVAPEVIALGFEDAIFRRVRSAESARGRVRDELVRQPYVVRLDVVRESLGPDTHVSQ